LGFGPDRGIPEILAGGTSTGTTLNGGTETVLAGGTSTGTKINGGTEYDYGTATGTTINSGGTEAVFAGGTATGTTINNGGTEVVSAGGNAVGVTFGGPQATLELAKPSGLIGPISNWHVGDVIDFLNTEVTSVQENTAHTILTVTYGTKATPRNKRVMLRFWVSEARLCNSILDGMRRL
jgi:autotransporter passenger strand-loop-strand repeat protein